MLITKEKCQDHLILIIILIIVTIILPESTEIICYNLFLIDAKTEARELRKPIVVNLGKT